MKGSATGGGSDGLAAIERILLRLEKGRRTGPDRWMACCPAHEDKTPSLSLRETDDGKALIHCFAGCSSEDVLSAVGLDWPQLFPDDPEWRPNGKHPKPTGYSTEDAWFILDIARGMDATGELDAKGREQAITALRVLLAAGETVGEEAAFLDRTEPVEAPIPPTLTEFQALEFPPTESLLGPFATQQLSLVYAPPGAGKTMFTLALGYSLARGLNFLRWYSSRPARVLVVDGEMVAAQLQGRLKGLESENLYVANLMSWGAIHDLEPLNLATPEGHALLLSWIEALEIEVVILDNLMSLAWIDGVSMNSDEAWQPVRRLLMAIRKAGKSAIIVDHTNASGQIFGTKTKLWHVDLAIRLSHVNEDDQEEDDFSGLRATVPRRRFRLSFDKVRGTAKNDQFGGTETDEIVVHMGDVGQPWEVESGEESMRRQAREMKSNGISIRDIAEELGVSKSKVGRWCKGI